MQGAGTQETARAAPKKESGPAVPVVRQIGFGVPGMDDVLSGGLPAGRGYLLRGGPGCGKTTLGLCFLSGGVRSGERALMVTLGEPVAQIRANAAALAIDLEGVEFVDFSPDADFFVRVESYDIFSPAEVEREPTAQRLVDAVETFEPRRVLIDSMTQFRYLASDPFQYRKQVLSLLRFLCDRGATVLFTSEGSAEAPDQDLQFLADGVLHLCNEDGNRYVSVEKLRGSAFLEGRHALTLGRGGARVHPTGARVPGKRAFVSEVLSFGVPALDELLGGGLERGTTTIISGPSGVGKTTLGLQFAKEAAGRGERTTVYAFEETTEQLLRRCEGINLPVSAMLQKGTLSVQPVDALRHSPALLTARICEEVERHDTQIVMLDTMSAFGLASADKTAVRASLHSLTNWLADRGVTLLLVNEIEGVIGEFSPTENRTSYLADNIVFLRYLELRGELRKAIGVLKKRRSDFEKTLREFEITRFGIKVGEPLRRLRGVLRGTPEEVGEGGRV